MPMVGANYSSFVGIYINTLLIYAFVLVIPSLIDNKFITFSGR